jgi:hypothetical protein
MHFHHPKKNEKNKHELYLKTKAKKIAKFSQPAWPGLSASCRYEPADEIAPPKVGLGKQWQHTA